MREGWERGERGRMITGVKKSLQKLRKECKLIKNVMKNERERGREGERERGREGERERGRE